MMKLLFNSFVRCLPAPGFVVVSFLPVSGASSVSIAEATYDG